MEYRDERLVLKDPVGNELTLRVKYTDSKSTGRIVTIFCPYLIVNKTGLNVYFSARSLMTANRITAGQSRQTHGGERLEPILFSYATFEPVRSRAHLKTDDSEWSKPISFEAVGTSYMVGLHSTGGLDTLLGVDVQEGHGKYYLSKVVTIKPRFMLWNCMKDDISFEQIDGLAPVLLKSSQKMPLMKLKTNPDHDDYQLSIRLANMLGSWFELLIRSNPFSLTELGTIYLKLGRVGSLTEDLVRIEITMDKATIFVTFIKEEGRWPFRIENNSSVDVAYCQVGSNKQYVIVPGEEQQYSWDFPSNEDKALILEINGRKRQIEITQLGPLLPFKYPIDGGRAIMDLELTAEGPTFVLKLSPYDESKSVFTSQSNAQADAFKLVTSFNNRKKPSLTFCSFSKQRLRE